MTQQLGIPRFHSCTIHNPIASQYLFQCPTECAEGPQTFPECQKVYISDNNHRLHMTYVPFPYAPGATVCVLLRQLRENVACSRWLGPEVAQRSSALVVPLIMVVSQEGRAEVPAWRGTAHGLSGTSAHSLCSSQQCGASYQIIRWCCKPSWRLGWWTPPHALPCLALYWDLPPDLMSLGTAQLFWEVVSFKEKNGGIPVSPGLTERPRVSAGAESLNPSIPCP